MSGWFWAVVAVAVVGLVIYFTETGREWASIILLLAIIFYGLFANPMKELHAEKDISREGKRGKAKRGSSKKKRFI
ncbi:MAG: hypothetical protein Q8P05_04825 [Candidatus Diapherotrites archaeon]|nr:hypothetical protein [Candidatus Diapherotrites archaeon]MDZ4256725.1 hypothetical protein [archaeon]